MNIFLVEDDNTLNELITKNLEALGYSIITFTDGQKAFDAIYKQFDIYLIDINLPSVNGLELIKQIKLSHTNAKIFIMSGDTNIETILEAYTLGCDDYIKKPFDIREIIAKINNSLINTPNIVVLSLNCIYDINNKVVLYKNHELQITNKETLLLDILIKNIGKTVNNYMIENYVWGDEVGNGYVRQLVSKLRKSLPCDLIKNHSSNGYKIEKFNNV